MLDFELYQLIETETFKKRACSIMNDRLVIIFSNFSFERFLKNYKILP